jgi:hypothetical protein
MAQTEIKDHVIWAKHVHGDAGLAARIVAMRAGEVIVLSVDGVTGRWRKMDDGKDGRPTAGLRPLGDAAEHWQALFQDRRGDVVEVEIAHSNEGVAALWDQRGMSEEQTAYRAGKIERADPIWKETAFEALLGGGRHGYASDEAWRKREEFYAMAYDRDRSSGE